MSIFFYLQNRFRENRKQKQPERLQMKYPYKVGVYVGRFQPVHAGHLKSIATALEDCEKLVIIIGSANRARTVKNPLSTNDRIHLLKISIKEWFNEPLNPGWTDFPTPSILDRVHFVSLRDYMYNNYKWVSEVQLAVAELGGTVNDSKTAIFGHKKDDTSFYLDMFPFWVIKTLPSYYGGLSSTEIRESLFTKGTALLQKYLISEVTPKAEEWLKAWINHPDQKFLHEEWEYYDKYGNQWASAPYVPTFVTVDSLVIRSGCILLIKRGFHPGKGLWALPGGFLDTNESILEGAIRELKEETSIAVPVSELREALKQVKTFDHPRRSLRGRTITYAHEFFLEGYGALPQVKAKSDAVGAHWVPISSLQTFEDKFFEDHFDIIFNLISKY